jgi:hypothetical protein
MNEFIELYLTFGIVTIPITLYIVITIIKELLDFFVNRKSINELFHKADNISLEQLDNNFEEYSKKLQSDTPWTKEHISVLHKKKELEAMLKKLYYKRDRDNNYFELQALNKSLKEYEREYWIVNFGRQKSKYELSRETRLRKVFTPE